MGYSAVVSDVAHNELDSAAGYIAQTPCAPSAVRPPLDECEYDLRALSINPFAYPVDTAASELLGVEVRKIRVKRYRLYYTVDDQARQVGVVSLPHTLQDKARIVIDYETGAYEN